MNMAKPKIVVFSGPTATIANSPTLVTRKIRRHTAHSLEGDAKAVCHVTLSVAEGLRAPRLVNR